MKQSTRIAAAALLLITCVGAVWALSDSKKVTMLFEAEWEVNTDLPGGGIIVGRGEGSNGVISVNLPMPPPTEAGEEPIQLTADEVSYMNITVIDDQGASRHFTEEHIRSISYDILFEYEWDNGIRQGYQIKHTAGTK